MAEKEAMLRLQGDYATDIRMCDRIETEPPRMAEERTPACTQSANSGVDR